MKTKASYILSIFIILSFAPQGFAAKRYESIDSLRKIISESSHDTTRIRLLNELAFEYYMDNKNDSCLKYASGALKLSDTMMNSEMAKNNPEYLNQCKKLKTISLRYFAKGIAIENKDAAIDTLQNALMLIRETGDKILEAGIFATIGNIYDFAGQNELALKNHLLSLDLIRETGNQSGLASQLTNVAIVERNMGSYGDAMENLIEALKISRQISDSTNMVEGLLAMGFVYLFVERWEDALNSQNEALEIFILMNDSLGIARIYNDMGVTNMNAGNLVEALIQHQSALAIRIKSNEVYDIFASYIYIGNIYEDLAMYPEAVNKYKECLRYARLAGFKISIIDAYLNLGGAYLKLHDFDKALAQFTSAMELSREIEDRTSEALASMNIAKIYLAWDNPRVALNWLRKAEKAAPKSALLFLGDIYQSIAETYFKLGDYESAYFNIKMYSQVKDSIVVAENLEKITKLTNKLEFENKQALQNESHQKILQLKQAEIDRQKIVRNFILFGMGVMLILAVIFLIRFIEKNKLNTKLNLLLVNLRSTQSQLVHAEKMASLG
nr:tetratricopeptide repeat protein [Bacteroidota bacterium]